MYAKLFIYSSFRDVGETSRTDSKINGSGKKHCSYWLIFCVVQKTQNAVYNKDKTYVEYLLVHYLKYAINV